MGVKKSIAFKLNVFMTSAIFIASTMLAVGIGIFYYLHAIKTLNNDVESMASIAELTLKSALWDLDTSSVEELSFAILKDESVAAVRVNDMTQTIQHQVISSLHKNYEFDQANDDKFITIKRAIIREEEELGTIEIAVSKDTAFEQFWVSSLVVSIGSLLLSFVLGLINYFISIVLIKKPVLKLSQEAHMIASGDLQTDIDISRNDELGQLAIDFAIMRDAIRNNIEVIHQHKLQLEEKVAVRTRQLKEETEKIKTIFDTLGEGIFTIHRDGRVDPEVSKSLLKIFDLEQIDSYDVSTLLLDRCDLDQETKWQILTVIEASICESELNFLSNQALLPKRMHYISSGKQKVLDLNWRAIVIEGNVESLVVSVRDMTELVDLDKRIKESNEQLLILKELMDVETSRAKRVVDDIIAECRQIVAQSQEDLNFKQMLSKLHTFKGNARTFGMKTLSGLIHQLEDDIGSRANAKILLFRYDQLRNTVEKYRYWLDRLHVPDSVITSRDLENIYELLNQKQFDEVKGRVAGLLGIYKDQSLKDFITYYMQHNLANIAADIGIKTPQLMISGATGVVSGQILEAFEACLMHMLRNSFDHGLKSLTDADQYFIQINLQNIGTFLEISYHDSGKGVNLDKLRAIASVKGLEVHDQLTEDHLNRLLFASGFSTAESISEFSGRGVGLDAVHQMMSDLGGNIRVEFIDKEHNGFQKIGFKMILPLLLQKAG